MRRMKSKTNPGGILYEEKPLGPAIRKGIHKGQIKERLLREKGVGVTYRPVKRYQQPTLQRIAGREYQREYSARTRPVDWSMVQDRSRFERPPIQPSPAFESESGIGTSIASPPSYSVPSEAPTYRTEDPEPQEPKN